MKKIIIISVILCLILTMCSAGCTSSATTSYPQILPSPNVKVDLIDSSSDWSLSKGVYYTATFSVYNIGDATAKNVYVNAKLVQNNGGVDDSKSVYVGNLAPGNKQTVKVILDGDWDESYKISYSVSY